jgi:hypothetical protein
MLTWCAFCSPFYVWPPLLVHTVGRVGAMSGVYHCRLTRCRYRAKLKTNHRRVDGCCRFQSRKKSAPPVAGTRLASRRESAGRQERPGPTRRRAQLTLSCASRGTRTDILQSGGEHYILIPPVVESSKRARSLCVLAFLRCGSAIEYVRRHGN